MIVNVSDGYHHYNFDDLYDWWTGDDGGNNDDDDDDGGNNGDDDDGKLKEVAKGKALVFTAVGDSPLAQACSATPQESQWGW